MEKKYDLTQNDMCKLFNINKRTLARWGEKGLPLKRDGIYPRYNMEDTKEWLEHRSAQATNTWKEKLTNLGKVNE